MKSKVTVPVGAAGTSKSYDFKRLGPRNNIERHRRKEDAPARIELAHLGLGNQREFGELQNMLDTSLAALARLPTV